MTTLETLIAARELLSDPARWTKKKAARGADGKEAIDIKDGVCFCAVGALWRTVGLVSYSMAEDIISETVKTKTAFGNVVSFNDAPSTTHADVLRIYDLAIERARQS